MHFDSKSQTVVLSGDKAEIYYLPSQNRTVRGLDNGNERARTGLVLTSIDKVCVAGGSLGWGHRRPPQQQKAQTFSRRESEFKSGKHKKQK